MTRLTYRYAWLLRFPRALGLVAVVCMGVGLGWPRNAYADFFGASPGALAQSHAALDTSTKCNDCHVNGDKALANDRCLACHDHKDLATRIAQGKGFHASSTVKGKKCESCHSDHKGRNYDLMGWQSIPGGAKSFKHDLAGWPLRGKHATTPCEKCHDNRNKQGLVVYLGQSSACASCHRNDQPHGFERKEMLACERCHGETAWKPTKGNKDFDHNDRKDAGMPLLGSHEDVSCAKCHPKAKFNLPSTKPDSCGNAGCHESPHDGHLFGRKECELCHSPTFKTLKEQNFDHDERTKFALGKAHSKMACYDCHTKALGEKPPQGNCEQCHAKENRHADRFNQFGDPPRCAVCHPSVAWRPTAFNHATRTKFALAGKHGQISCRGCHRGSGPTDFERFSVKTTGCMGCHAHTSVHQKKFKDSQCVSCHFKPGSLEVKREEMVKVYHGPRSRFPLVKAHKGLGCDECHKAGKFDPPPSLECGDGCHKDAHQGQLGETCSRCHSSGTWDALEFSHNEDSKFMLKGEHTRVACEGCHASGQYLGTPQTCGAAGCHAEDDVHQGRLGDKCERCHAETGENFFNHNTMSSFTIDGRHLDVRCSDCHPSQTFKPRPATCVGCHPEPAVHRGQYGTLCEQCHTTRSFMDIRPLHDVGDFALKGAHDRLACVRCHKDSRALGGSGNQCVNCHRQDDIHQNALSPRCGECHTQWAFAPARFEHARVGCNLVGLHRTLPCADCHRAGNYAATPAMCVACHRDDAQRKDDAHKAYPTCANCHNTNAWSPQLPFGRESICR